ncbi:hypothetical protein [Methylobacter sp.]|uniref:hypothetical protein n=1 Tax=Methylobacter sp. TaxID=2051955 RepID=UPI003DA21C27
MRYRYVLGEHAERAPERSVDIYRKWHWRYCSHPWVGHDLPLDDGPWVASN